MKMPLAAISIDVDTLSSIYKGVGLTRKGGYTYVELRSGLENLVEFFESFGIKTTLFMVGDDFLPEQNHTSIKMASVAGHELANHSMTHPQGFRWLTSVQKEKEIVEMGKICKEVTGYSPLGFRSPGWNMDDSALPILKKLGYQYDSSVFPTFLMPVMKAAHWISMSGGAREDRTTMGMWRYMLAPLAPYETNSRSFARKGKSGFVEFPVSVTPLLRIPFFATLLLFLGSSFYDVFYRRLRTSGAPIHFQMHLSDFVDYSLLELQDQMPARHKGAYVPQALSTPLQKKLEIFKRMVDRIAVDYEFLTLKEWASTITG